MFAGKYRGTRVLVTGHTGFKGAWLSQWLLSLGAEVAGYSRDVPTSPSLFETLGLAAKLSHQFGDLLDLSGLQNCLDRFQPEIVFHLAAQAIVRRSYENPKDTFDSNVSGTVNLLEAVRHTPSVKTVVVVTSDKCYQNTGSGKAYRETDALGGDDPYSASKGATEIVAGAYARSFFSRDARVTLLTARAGNVIGGGDWAPDRMVPDCARAWRRQEPVVIRNPTYTRPWQHVLEALSGYLELAAQSSGDPRFAGESFNFGPSEEEHSVLEVVTRLTEIWPNARWVTAESRSEAKREAPLLRLNCDKAREWLKWRSLLTFNEAVDATSEWYRAFCAGNADLGPHTELQIAWYEKLAAARGLAWAQDSKRGMV